ncbi:MAG: AMP-binding protein [Clostridia bacterium]|nr:AMP-binding protein [Clostridia bacterium]
MKKENYEYNKVQRVSSIKELLELAVKDCGNKDAFKYRENGKIVSITYEEFQRDTIELGTALSSIGVEDSHIAVIGENSYDWITVYLTVLKSKGVIVPIDKELIIEDIINILKNSDSEVLFYSKKYEKYIEQIEKEVPNIKYFIGFKEENNNGKKLSYKKLKQTGKKLFEEGNDTYIHLENDKDKLKMLVYTSGTTGMAKGVMLSEHNLVSCVYYGLQVSTVYDKCLSVLPYHHTYEAVAGILVSLHHHSTICINENLKMVLKNLQEYKPEYVYLVPAFIEIFYKKIWDGAKESGKDKILKTMISISNFLRKIGIDMRKILFKSIHKQFGGNLIKIVCGGAPIRAELGYFFDSIGFDLINGYGITECSPLVSANRDRFNDCSTVGVVLPCCEIKFENVTPEGDGEICVKGDIVMLGYYKDEQRTKDVLKKGWFNTGDYGKFNEKGQLLITGRKKNLIVLKNGKNVFPEEIENYIMGIPYVSEVVVKGIKDDNGAETRIVCRNISR